MLDNTSGLLGFSYAVIGRRSNLMLVNEKRERGWVCTRCGYCDSQGKCPGGKDVEVKVHCEQYIDEDHQYETEWKKDNFSTVEI